VKFFRAKLVDGLRMSCWNTICRRISQSHPELMNNLKPCTSSVSRYTEASAFSPATFVELKVSRTSCNACSVPNIAFLSISFHLGCDCIAAYTVSLVTLGSSARPVRWPRSRSLSSSNLWGSRRRACQETVMTQRLKCLHLLGRLLQQSFFVAGILTRPRFDLR